MESKLTRNELTSLEVELNSCKCHKNFSLNQIALEPIWFHIKSKANAFWLWVKLYSCLNVKELLAQSRREIWSLSDCNWTRTNNHLVHKRTPNHCSHSNVLWINILNQHSITYLIKERFFWNSISISGTNHKKIIFTIVSTNIFSPNLTRIWYYHLICWNLHNISCGKKGKCTDNKLNTQELIREKKESNVWLIKFILGEC